MRVNLPRKKTGRPFGLVLFFVFFLSTFAKAESIPSLGPADTLPSKWAIGLGTGWLADYPGAAQGRLRFLPFPVYRGALVRLDRISGVSGQVFNNSKWDFSWNFIFQFPTNSASIPVREGMPNLDWLLSIGPQVKYYFYRGTFHRTYFRMPLRINTCTNFSTRTQFCGLTFNPGVRHSIWMADWGEITFRWEAFSHTSEYQQYFYEVQSNFATPTRPSYHAQAGFLGFVYGFFHSLPFDGWEVSTSVNLYDYSLAANQDSPLFVHKTNYGVFLAFVFDINPVF